MNIFGHFSFICTFIFVPHNMKNHKAKPTFILIPNPPVLKSHSTIPKLIDTAFFCIEFPETNYLIHNYILEKIH